MEVAHSLEHGASWEPNARLVSAHGIPVTKNRPLNDISTMRHELAIGATDETCLVGLRQSLVRG